MSPRPKTIRTYALTWVRSPEQAEMLGKPAGFAVSNYPTMKRDDVVAAAEHINSIDPAMDCGVKEYII